MATMETTERARTKTPVNVSGRTSDETKLSLKTTEFWAMAGLIVAILIASAVSDSLDDVRAWTLVAAVAIGYMISRGLAKSGSKYAGGDRPAQPHQRLDARYSSLCSGRARPGTFPFAYARTQRPRVIGHQPILDPSTSLETAARTKKVAPAPSQPKESR